MSESILNSTKKVLGVSSDYTAFDEDIIMHINTVFTILNDLGLGPDGGFMIEDADAVWANYIGTDKNLNAIKTYVYLRVRMLFDPPTTSYLQDAMQKQISELEWRLNVRREVAAYPLINPDNLIEIDGGGAAFDPYGEFIYDGGGA